MSLSAFSVCPTLPDFTKEDMPPFLAPAFLLFSYSLLIKKQYIPIVYAEPKIRELVVFHFEEAKKQQQTNPELMKLYAGLILA